MYTAATFTLAKATGVTLPNAIPAIFIYIALVAWITTFTSMIIHLVQQAGKYFSTGSSSDNLPASRNYISIVAVNSLVIDPTR
jgi:hypothetical protein